jgi:hypothetical protein
MSSLTISAAARLCHMDRRTLQRAIHAGRLHLDAHHCLSTDELLLAGYLLEDTPHGTPQGVPWDTPHSPPQDAPQEPPQAAPLLPVLNRLTLAVEDLVHEVRQLREGMAQSPQAAPHSPPQDAPQYTPQVAPQTDTPRPGSYDRDSTYARIQALQAQGLTQRQIAAQLTADGIPTKQGGPWGQSSVRYLLSTYGR